ncbi:MAG TPA: ABC transporter substrate-binding protein, partial [bacterium]|nr:ABC transporter substrate-binding protein [bacterium]
MRRRLTLVPLALGLAALLAGCPPPAKPADKAATPEGTTGEAGTTEGQATAGNLPSVITIGEVAALTGEIASFGIATDNGTTLAVDQLNAQQFFGPGITIDLKKEDDGSTPTGASTAAKKLISEQQVVALLGEVASKNSLAMAPIAQENQVPMISPSSTNPDVTELEYVFRACYLDTFQGQTIARFAYTALGKRKGAILYDQTNAYSEGLKDAITAEFTRLGGAIAATEAYSAGDTDYRSVLAKIKGSTPDVVFLPGYATDTALIISQARQENIQGPFVGGDGWDMPELLQKGGQAVEGTYFTTHYVETDPDPMVQDFVKAYQAKFNIMPDAIAALGYDSTLMLADAIKRAGTVDGPALRDAIAATKGFKGVTGEITLDPKGDPQKGIVIITIRNGKREFHSRFDAQGNPIVDTAMADGTTTTEGAAVTNPDGTTTVTN